MKIIVSHLAVSSFYLDCMSISLVDSSDSAGKLHCHSVKGEASSCGFFTGLWKNRLLSLLLHCLIFSLPVHIPQIIPFSLLRVLWYFPCTCPTCHLTSTCSLTLGFPTWSQGGCSLSLWKPCFSISLSKSFLLSLSHYWPRIFLATLSLSLKSG